jgi:ketosteroid isomerase-like protein
VDIPAIDRWLATVPKPYVVAEFPLDDELNVGAADRRHSQFMLHSTAHWQKTVHGYSGVRPALHYGLFSEMTQFPDEISLLALASVGVGYVVIHTDYYPPGEWARVEARLPRFSHWLTLEKVIGHGRVYSVRQPSPEQLLRGRFEEFVSAIRAGDSQTLATFYSLDALLSRPDGRIFNGRDQIAEWLMQNPEEATAITMEADRFDAAAGTVRGRFTLGSGRSARHGEFMQVWKIVELRWRLAAELFSVTDTQP